MRIQLVQTTGWYEEGGQSTWGFGIEVHHFAGHDDDHELKPEGWQIQIMFGNWAVQVSSEGGFEAVYGDSVQHFGMFSLERP